MVILTSDGTVSPTASAARIVSGSVAGTAVVSPRVLITLGNSLVVEGRIVPAVPCALLRNGVASDCVRTPLVVAYAVGVYAVKMATLVARVDVYVVRDVAGIFKVRVALRARVLVPEVAETLGVGSGNAGVGVLDSDGNVLAYVRAVPHVDALVSL